MLTLSARGLSYQNIRILHGFYEIIHTGMCAFRPQLKFFQTSAGTDTLMLGIYITLGILKDE